MTSELHTRAFSVGIRREAGIVSSHGAEVITANLTHFSRIEGLRCRHWN